MPMLLSLAAMDTCDKPDGAEALRLHSHLVQHIARGMIVGKPASVQLDDLVQAGMIGLMEAAERYRPERGVAFTAYAGIRVRGAMVDELRKADPLSRSGRQLVRNREAAIERLKQRHLQAPREGEIADELGIPYATYLRKLTREAHGGFPQSLDDLDADAADDDLGDGADANDPWAAIVDHGGDPSERLQARQRVEGVTLAIESLRPRDRVALEKYYFDDMSLREIGRELGVSESRVCQLLARTTAQLRAMLAS